MSIKHYYDSSEDQTKWQRQRAWLEDAPNRLGTSEMKDIFGGVAPFSYPKPTALVKWCLGLHPKKNALVLDFFAGSGTTAHAVAELNSEDGGSRRWILVTNNEGETDDDPSTGIMRSVTKPRIDTVLTGIRPDGTKYSDGIDGGYDFFAYDLEHVKRTSSYRKALSACGIPAVMDGLVRIRYGVGALGELSIDGNVATGRYASPDEAIYVSVLYGVVTRETIMSAVDQMTGKEEDILIVPDEMLGVARDVLDKTEDKAGLSAISHSAILTRDFLR